MPLDPKLVIDQIDILLDQHKRLKSRSRYDDFSDLPRDEVGEAAKALARL